MRRISEFQMSPLNFFVIAIFEFIDVDDRSTHCHEIIS